VIKFGNPIKKRERITLYSYEKMTEWLIMRLSLCGRCRVGVSRYPWSGVIAMLQTVRYRYFFYARSCIPWCYIVAMGTANSLHASA